MKVAEGLDLKGGRILQSRCPRCGASDKDSPFRITLKPMWIICTNCGQVLVEYTDEEEEAIQNKMIEETGIPIGGCTCGGHEEN